MKQRTEIRGQTPIRWDHFLIVYGDLTVHRGQVTEWNRDKYAFVMDWQRAPGSNVQVVRLCNSQVAQILGGYDIYAIWTNDDDLVAIQAGPGSVYGQSHFITMPPRNVSISKDFVWEDLSSQEREIYLRRSKLGEWTDDYTHERARQIAMTKELCQCR